MSNKTLHHFKNICIDKDKFNGVKTIKNFITEADHQAKLQTWYFSPPNDPTRGRNKYFGDAGESLFESVLLELGNHKSINCTNYRPTPIDEFGVDGEGWFVKEDGSLGRLAIQIKMSSDPNHYYDSSNSNILNAVAALPVFGYERLLFINTGAGITPGLLTMLNQRDNQLVYQLNRNDLNKLIDGSPIVWTNWYNSLLDI
jgi:hypothetical protein